MSLRPDGTATLRAIVDSTDPQVSAKDRLRALELLAEHEHVVTEGADLALAAQIVSMRDDELEREVLAFFPADVRAQIKARLGAEGRAAEEALEERFAELQKREAELARREERLAERERRVAAERGHERPPGRAEGERAPRPAEGSNAPRHCGLAR